MNPERTVIVAGLAAGGLPMLVSIRDSAGDQRDARQVRIMVGTFTLIGVLLLAAQFVPDAAAALAVLIMVTSLVLYGGELGKLLASLVD